MHVKWYESDEPKTQGFPADHCILTSGLRAGGQQSFRCSYEDLSPWSKTEQRSTARSLLIQKHWRYLASLDYHGPSESLLQSDVPAVSPGEAQPCLVVFS